MTPAAGRKALLLHSAYTTDLDDIMGFEELAALKQQLSKRTQASKPERADTQRAPRASATPDGATDAVANVVAAQRPPRRHNPASPGQNAGKPATHRGPRAGNTVSAKSTVPASTAAPVEGQAPRMRNERRADPRAQQRTDGRTDARPDRRGGSPDTPRGPSRQDGKRQTTPVDPVVITIGQLQKRFPKAFPKNPLPKVPLKLGISKDLAAQAESLALSEAELLEAIKVWCQGNRYWSSMTKDAARVNLAGEPEGVVTPEQASRARSLSATHRRAKRPAAKKAEPTVAADGASVPAPVSAPVSAPSGDDVATTTVTSDVPSSLPVRHAESVSAMVDDAPVASVESPSPAVEETGANAMSSPQTANIASGGHDVKADPTPDHQALA